MNVKGGMRNEMEHGMEWNMEWTDHELYVQLYIFTEAEGGHPFSIFHFYFLFFIFHFPISTFEKRGKIG